jgi:hypothetical protein
MLPDDRHEELMDGLADRDVFFAARVLRLSLDRPRESDLAVDLARYRDALRFLAPLAGPDVADELGEVEVATTAESGWTALRHTTDGHAGIQPGWDALEGLAGEETIVWQGNPFASRSPELLAAAEVLMRFKRAFNHAVPAPDAPSPDERPPSLPDTTAELSVIVLDRAREVAEAERELRARTGLARTRRLMSLDGEPRITVTTGSYGAWLDEEWGADRAEVILPASPENEAADALRDAARSLLEGSARDLACKRLRMRTEAELGSALGSAAWNRPTALAGWVW